MRKTKGSALGIQTLTDYIDRLEARFSRDPLFYLKLEGEPQLPDKKSSIIFVNEPYKRVHDFFERKCSYNISKSKEANLVLSRGIEFTGVDFFVIPPHQTAFRLYHQKKFKEVIARRSALSGYEGIWLEEAKGRSTGLRGVIWNLQCVTWAPGVDSMIFSYLI